MKLIVAIIQPHKLEEVKDALGAVDVNLMTVVNVHGQASRKGTRRSIGERARPEVCCGR